jgi:hypothetical protein
MGKRLLRGGVWGVAALGPFVLGVAAAIVVCGAPLAPHPDAGSVDTAAPSDSDSGRGREKTQEVTYEPWELVST